ncbi:MAG: hypothetical protein WA823_02200 [Candidatus Acidiferrales bacterium]
MSGYDIQQVGDTTEISTTPEAVPAPWLLIAIPGGLLVLLALAMGFFYGVVAQGFCHGAMYLLMHPEQATQYRTPAKIRVLKTGIEVAGTTIPKDTIYRVIVRNHVLKAAGDVIIVADPHPNSGQQNTVAGMKWGSQQARTDLLSRGRGSAGRSYHSCWRTDGAERRRDHVRCEQSAADFLIAAAASHLAMKFVPRKSEAPEALAG